MRGIGTEAALLMKAKMMTVNSKSNVSIVADTDDRNNKDDSRKTAKKKSLKGGELQSDFSVVIQTKSGKLLNERKRNKNQNEDDISSCSEEGSDADIFFPTQANDMMAMWASTLLRAIDPEAAMMTDPFVSSSMMKGREELPSLNENDVDDQLTNPLPILDDAGFTFEDDPESFLIGKPTGDVGFGAMGDVVEESKQESSSPATAAADSKSQERLSQPPPTRYMCINAPSNVEDDRRMVGDILHQQNQVYDPGFGDLMLQPFDEMGWSVGQHTTNPEMMLSEDTLVPHDPLASLGFVGFVGMEGNKPSSDSVIGGGSSEAALVLPSTPNVKNGNYPAEFRSSFPNENTSPETLLSMSLALSSPSYDKRGQLLMNGGIVPPIPFHAMCSNLRNGAVMPFGHPPCGAAPMASLMRLAPTAPTTLQQQQPNMACGPSVEAKCFQTPVRKSLDVRSTTMASSMKEVPQVVDGQAPRKGKQKRPSKRFQKDQTEVWTQRVQEATHFRMQHGHCHIPCAYPANQQLATWAKRQRHQYYLLKKLMIQHRRFENADSIDSNSIGTFASYDETAKEKGITLTAERIVALERIGFCWNARTSSWATKFQELQQCIQKNGNSNVRGRSWSKSILAWAKCQRHQYKKWLRNKPSQMTKERAKLLVSVGFDFRTKSPTSPLH